MAVNDVLIIIGLAILGIAAIIFIPRWQIRRTIPKVIKAFRDNNALDTNTARSIEDLGLKPRGIIMGSFRGRDYRQQTMMVLINAGIIQTTEEGLFYLDEAKMFEVGLDIRSK
jgi:hypothetical protein